MKKGTYKDITGQKFNKLTAVEFVEIKRGIGSIWKFQCDCGKIVELPAGRVKYGTTKSCGCINHSTQPKIDITGMNFGKWTVIEKVGKKWRCRCKCGNESLVSSFDLRNGNSRSCRSCCVPDLTGTRFGRWTVLYRAENRGTEVRYMCKCDCGTKKSVSAHSLLRGESTSCGCKHKRNLIGQRFGRLVVVGIADDHITNSGKHVKRWRCICDCGNETIVRHGELVNGHTTSCGCYHKEIIGNINRTHGLSHKSHLYSVWKGMKDRCYREKCKSYKNYGGRGISVCDEWRNDYKAFHDWAIANGYEEKMTSGGKNILSIDRINNDGNYEPSNCRWTTAKVQANNKRRRPIVHENNTM